VNRRMKILIGYDGSECADAALEDLRWAGLPDVAEAVVFTAADVFVPPTASEADEVFPLYVPPAVKRAHTAPSKSCGLRVRNRRLKEEAGRD